MSHQVVWTRKTYEFFCEAAQLSDLEREILSTRISGMTIQQQAFYFSLSTSTINKITQRLKQKYDVVQQEHPDKLRPRRNSVYETYQDEH